jgi:hypothetical protein
MGAYETKKDGLELTPEEKESIKNKSPQRAMPLNPTAQGWSGAQIRAQLLRAVLDDENSVLAILEGRFSDLKDILEDLYDMVLLESFDGLSPKETLVGADVVAINDSEDAGAIKKATLSSVASFIEIYVGGLFGDLEEDIDSKIDKDISGYPEATLSDSSLLYILKNGISQRVNLSVLKTYMEQGRMVFVNELPATGETGKIYLVPQDGGEGTNIKDEYLWNFEDEKFEKIGSTEIELEDMDFGSYEEVEVKVIDGGSFTDIEFDETFEGGDF